jgi:hypothetical protein
VRKTFRPLPNWAQEPAICPPPGTPAVVGGIPKSSSLNPASGFPNCRHIGLKKLAVARVLHLCPRRQITTKEKINGRRSGQNGSLNGKGMRIA